MKLLTKSDISHGPQLGSQMTQLAALYSVSKKLGSKIVFIKDHLFSGRGNKLIECFDLPFEIVDNFYRQRIQIQNKLMDESVFNLNPDVNYDLLGFFHSYHYWTGFEDEVKKLFKFKKNIEDTASEFISNLKKDKPLISVHFRRTDYLTQSSLNLGMDYYKVADKIIRSEFGDVEYIVFSDDINWCQNNVMFENVYFSKNNHFVDMCAMSKCDGHIIANSSFSWWGAYLNQQPNVVICPFNYIGPSDKHHQFINGNYFPKEWVAI